MTMPDENVVKRYFDARAEYERIKDLPDSDPYPDSKWCKYVYEAKWNIGMNIKAYESTWPELKDLADDPR